MGLGLLGLKELWTVEYSVDQDSFHVAEFEETLDNNQKSMFARFGNDYQIVELCMTRDKALEMAEKYRNAIGYRL